MTTEPLGPDTLTWRHYGDLRIILLGPWMVTMHSMWPPLGAAIEQTNNLLYQPMQRAARSMDDVMSVVYGTDAAAQQGRRIRDYHRNVSAEITQDCPIDIEPGRYHSMNPETFYWAHSCFFVALIWSIERFGGGLTEDQCRQLYDEHVRWYAMYGVTMRPVPDTWDDFLIYWDKRCTHLQVTPTTEALLHMRPEGILGLLALPALSGARWIADGCMTDTVRHTAERDWTALDEWVLTRFGNAVNLSMRLVPDRIRWHSAALSAMYGRRKGKLANIASVAVAWSILTTAGALSMITRRGYILGGNRDEI